VIVGTLKKSLNGLNCATVCVFVLFIIRIEVSLCLFTDAHCCPAVTRSPHGMNKDCFMYYLYM